MSHAVIAGERRPVDRPSSRHQPRLMPPDMLTTARMRRVRRTDTYPEQVVRRLAAQIGLHYRLRNKDLPGSPDLANRHRRWAIFVHGCFWHHHARCPEATMPKRNRDYWKSKFAGNMERDRHAVSKLRQLGYRTIVVWECSAIRSPRVVQRALSRLR